MSLFCAPERAHSGGPGPESPVKWKVPSPALSPGDQRGPPDKRPELLTQNSAPSPSRGDRKTVWHYQDDQGALHQVSLEALVKLYRGGKIHQSTYLWRYGLRKWIRLADCPELPAPIKNFESAAKRFREKRNSYSGAPHHVRIVFDSRPLPFKIKRGRLGRILVTTSKDPRVKEGHRIVAVNESYIDTIKFSDVLKLLRTTNPPLRIIFDTSHDDPLVIPSSGSELTLETSLQEKNDLIIMLLRENSMQQNMVEGLRKSIHARAASTASVQLLSTNGKDEIISPIGSPRDGPSLEKVEKLKIEIKVLTKRFNDAKAEANHYKEKWQEIEFRLAQRTEEQRELREKVNLLTTKEIDYQNTIRSLQGKNSEFRRTQEHNATRLQALEGAETRKFAEIQKLTKKYEDELKLGVAKSAQIEELTERLRTVDFDSSQARKANVELDDKLQSQMAKLAELRTQLKEQTAEATKQQTVLEQKVKQLESEATGHRNVVKSLEGEVEKTTLELKKLRENQQNKPLQVQNGPETLDMEPSPKGESAMEIDDGAEDHVTELEEAQIRIMDLEEKIEELQEQVAQSGGGSSEEMDLLKSENEKLTKLKEDADGLEAELMGEIEAMSTENEKLSSELEVAGEKWKASEGRVRALESEVLAIQTKLEAYSTADNGGVNVDKYVKQIRRLRTETGEAKVKIRDLENSLEQESNKARIEACRTENLQEKVEEMEEMRLLLDERIQNLTTDLEEERGTLARLRKEVADG